MYRYKNEIVCRKRGYPNTNMNGSFNVVKYTFNYLSSSEDKKILDRLIRNGNLLSENVNDKAANSSVSRDIESVKINSIAGLLAEFLWLDFMNNSGVKSEETTFLGSSNQIDIKIVDSNKTVEVRSSFPRNGLEFALCHNIYEFDVLGPYSNDYKPGEIQKDFYVRTLFPFQVKDFYSHLLNDDFTIYLTGGATWQMMGDVNISKIKDLVPDDEINLDNIKTKSSYKVVPFSNALDTFEIVNLMKT